MTKQADKDSTSEAVDNSPLKERIEKLRKARHKRTTVGSHRYRLHIQKDKLDPNYFYRFFNDDNDELGQAERAGYVYVTKKELDDPDIVGDKEVHGGNTDLNSFVSRVVGRDRGGKPLRAYLMKLPMEIWLEDRAFHEKEVNGAVDRSLRRGTPKGSAVENAYGVKMDYKHGE